MDKEIQDQPWERLSTNLAIKAFLEDHKSRRESKLISIAQVVKDFVKNGIHVTDILKIIFFCSGDVIYVSKNENTILKNKLRGRISPDAYGKLFKWYTGKRLYIPSYESVVKSYKNSLIFKALKRSNKLRNRRRLSEQYNVTMSEVARIYRNGIIREKKKAKEKEIVELEKALQK